MNRQDGFDLDRPPLSAFCEDCGHTALTHPTTGATCRREGCDCLALRWHGQQWRYQPGGDAA